MIKLLFVFSPVFLSLWFATQKLAELVNYDPLLGEGFIYQNQMYYMPYKYFIWYIHLHQYIPQLFNQTYIYFFAGLFGSLTLIFLMRPKPELTSHGSARFGEYNDLLKMDLISANGVVIGSWDNNFIKLFASILRSLEVVKNKKIDFAEMTFRDKETKKREQLFHRIDYIEKRIAYGKKTGNFYSLPTAKQKKIEQTLVNLKKQVNKPIKYDAKKENLLTVYPFVWLYKQAFKLYTHCPHFYLRDNSNKHLAVIAPTRSGKGVGLIIPTLLGGWIHSVIVNDIKSENWGITSGYRKRMGQTVIKFEPTAEDGSSARWNPIDEIAIGTPSEVSTAQNLGMSIANYEGKGKMDHWGQNAANVIALVILHMKYAHFSDPENYPNPVNLYQVASFLKANIVPELDENGNPIMLCFDEDTGTPLGIQIRDENGNLTPKYKTGSKDDAAEYDMPPHTVTQEKMNVKGFFETLKAMQNFEHVPDKGIDITEWDTKQLKYVTRHFTPDDLKELYPNARSLDIAPNVHPIISQGFTEILSKAEQECASIISTANTALKEYLDPVLAKNTSISDFCIDDVMNYTKSVSLYLVTPPSDLLRLSPIFRLFFEMMVQHHAKIIGVYKQGRVKNIYKHRCLFLMDEFSSLGNLQTFASTLSYIAGYGMKVFLINQGLPQINGIYGKDNQILMNCHLQIIYAPNDNDTGKYAESLLGNKTITVESISDNGWFTRRTYSKSQTGRALMTSDEIKRMGDKELIIASGNPPIITDKIKYYEDNYFLKKLLDAPIASDLIRPNPYPLRDKLIAKHKQMQTSDQEFTFKYNENL